MEIGRWKIFLPCIEGLMNTVIRIVKKITGPKTCPADGSRKTDRNDP